MDISDDQLVYTFHLREDGMWSNGDPVTAGDFAFAWQQALNPDVAADYAYFLFFIKNAEAPTSRARRRPEAGESRRAGPQALLPRSGSVGEVRMT